MTSAPGRRANNPLISSLILLVILLSALLLLVPSDPVMAQGGGQHQEGATVWGYVYNANNEQYLSNMTVKVERDYYLGNETMTDGSGYYDINLPAGAYLLRIIDEDGYVIYRLDFNISQDEEKRLDFGVDPSNRNQARVLGTIRHSLTLAPMEAVDVLVYRLSAEGSYRLETETTTDENGDFDMDIPAGQYEIYVRSDEKKLYKDKFQVNVSQEKEFELVLEDPARALSLENALRILQTEYVSIGAMIAILVIGLLMIGFVDKAFKASVKSLEAKPRRFIDIPMMRFSERVVKWNIIILMLIFMSFFVAQILDIVSTLWIPIRNSIVSIYTIILLVVFLRITLMIWTLFIVYMRGDHRHKKPKKILSSRMITVIELIGKYSIAFFFIFSILLTALAALGMSDLIIGGFMDSLISNAGFIIFILSLIVILYIAVKFSATFFEDMKYKTTRFRPEMIEVAGKGVKVFIYAIIGMIIIFTLLSAAGMGEVGQTIVIVFSMIVGLVVSMAATGSIGNMLSGLVIMSFKPFDEGDWVSIADKHQGEIIEMNLMFTKLRDLEDELIEIPNNLILTMGIVNWTTAAKKGGFAIEVDTTISYEIPAKQVMELMVSSCEGIEGVLKGRDPHVVTSEFYNHAIGYKLRAYIGTPHNRNKLRTEIMVNMQKKFAEAGVEILSPLYEIGRLERIPSQEEIKKKAKKKRMFE